MENSHIRRRGSVVASIEECIDGFCPVKFFSDEQKWEEEKASEQLVYIPDKDMRLKFYKRPSDGSICDFLATITTNKKDSDGDILETEGAELDGASPLLWQHSWMMPIGKVLGVVEHTKSRLSARCSIADTELGRDAVKLLRMDALRISHGFEPTEFEPFKDGGWHIKKFNIFEVSLVSIPANTDAVVHAFEEKSFESQFMNGWVKKLKGPKIHKVDVDVSALNEDVDSHLETLREKGGRTISKQNESHIKEAIADLDEAMGMEAPRGCKALIGSAKGRCTSVLASVTPAEDDEHKSIKDIGVALLKNMSNATYEDIEWLRAILDSKAGPLAAEKERELMQQIFNTGEQE